MFRSRLEGSELGVLESWRYLRGASMAVRTSLRPAGGGPEAVMFWFFDRMETLQRHVARGGGASLLQKIETGAPRWVGGAADLRGQLRLSVCRHQRCRHWLALPCPNSPPHPCLTLLCPSLAAAPQTSGMWSGRRARTRSTFKTYCWTGSAGSLQPTISFTWPPRPPGPPAAAASAAAPRRPPAAAAPAL